MRDLRRLLCWLFAISSLLCLWNAYRLILHIMHRHDAFRTLRSLLIAGLFPVLAAIYAMSWWMVWRDKPSARAWGIAASSAYVVLSLWAMFYSSRFGSSLGVMLAVGASGLFVFLWRDVRSEVR